ncbi:hypothetical protein [Lacticaseibacillus daqingensis]|uniref:hypothetical protein n=1 Tax=Lacticaseibacillus daqingensis TaxID=2486014 RepID=UPI0013DE0B75|nr:hypothetical protein [Lacticaseibacillus daqingensis]
MNDLLTTLLLWLLSHGPTVAALVLVFMLGVIAGAFVQFAAEDAKKAHRVASR